MESQKPKKKPRGTPFKKGNPGKPKGAVNKFPTALKDKVLHAAAACEAAGKDLSTLALADPVWFFETFVKPMLPKEMAVTGEGGGALCVVIKDLRLTNG